MAQDIPETVTSGRLLARNTLINFLGQGIPMLVALVSIPALVAGLGTDRFGILALAWMAIGYFSFFDLGIGRAITQCVAERVGNGREEEVPPLVWTALVLMALLGAVGGVVLALLAPWLIHSILKVPPALEPESVKAFRLIALSLPWVVSTAGLRGILEAKQRFDLTNMVRLPMGVFTFLAPVMVLPFSRSVAAAIGVLLAGRLVTWAVHLVLCLRVMPGLRRVVVERRAVRPLMRYGSWLTVSNIVSPLMDGVDRFIVGAVLSVSAVAYYVTPYEVVTKLWVVTSAVLGVLFPAFAASFLRDSGRTALLFDRGVRAVFLTVFPLALVLVTFAREGLGLWVGSTFAENSTGALQWLAVGVFVNTIAQVAYTLIQGVGRPDITGKLHLMELPIYLLLIWGLLNQFGVVGAAMAWTIRASLDAIALLLVAGELVPTGRAIVRRTAVLLLVAVLVLASGAFLEGLLSKGVFLAAGLVGWMAVGWTRVLTHEERALLVGAVRRGATPSAVTRARS